MDLDKIIIGNDGQPALDGRRNPLTLKSALLHCLESPCFEEHMLAERQRLNSYLAWERIRSSDGGEIELSADEVVAICVRASRQPTEILPIPVYGQIVAAINPAKLKE